MDIPLIMLMLLLGAIGSFFSGLLGIGGAIINYPLLLLVPAGLGLAQFSAQEVSAISMYQVFFSSLAGIVAMRKQDGHKVFHQGLILYMGSSILLGSLTGGMASRFLNEEVIHMVYGVLAAIAVLLMLIPVKGQQEEAGGTVVFHIPLAVAVAFAVGIVSGVAGAGGAFILIPVMLAVLKIPARMAISSSLAIVLISSFGGVIGKLAAGPIPLWPTVFVVAGSLLGATMGSRVSSILDVRYLRYALLILIAASAVKIWASIV
ncbi:sulfite exporter TauE/SafE family protein [Paenibacillus pinihumi]|uniref:sulfite exporter TauE/SafE family protein n=1 Tax=Paenibacillus pinihumi TaxID=669462 RepID=UPI000414D86C|nr:sulfite exporter TauE/SafE family protein [Paenibacillus pinihumi]